MEILKDKILENHKHNYDCLILFGSYSRNDYNINSDIDVLQIYSSKERYRSYSFENINYSMYTFDMLSKMAEEGNLFVMHVLKEGSMLAGDIDFFYKLQMKFNNDTDYRLYQNDLIAMGNSLDIDESLYNENWKNFNLLLCFLFRSYLYVLAFEKGNLNFSVKFISSLFDDKEIEHSLQLRKDKQLNYDNFLRVKKHFEFYTGTTFQNSYKDLEHLIDSVKENTYFPLSIGLHFLKGVVQDEFY